MAMTQTTDLVPAIVRSLEDPSDQRVLQEFRFGGDRLNELLFFFKPECFLVDSAAHVQKTVAMARQKIAQFGAEVTGALWLRGPYLRHHGVMDRHYGYINRLSRQASTLLTPDELASILEAVVASRD